MHISCSTTATFAVEPDYLRRVLAPLSNPQVGLVTCLYRGVAAGTVGSRLEALGISTDFCAGVLAARLLEGLHFGLGSTLTFRRADLEKIGGCASFVDHLADDYELGKRISDLGLTVTLSEVVVETFLFPLTVFGNLLLISSRSGTRSARLAPQRISWPGLHFRIRVGASGADSELGSVVGLGSAGGHAIASLCGRARRGPDRAAGFASLEIFVAASAAGSCGSRRVDGQSFPATP